MQSVWKTKAPNTSSLLFDRYLQIQQYHDNRRWRSQVMVESSGTDDQWTRRLFKQFILSHTFFYHNNSLIRLSVKTVPNKLPILSGYKPLCFRLTTWLRVGCCGFRLNESWLTHPVSLPFLYSFLFVPTSCLSLIKSQSEGSQTACWISDIITTEPSVTKLSNSAQNVPDTNSAVPL